MSPASPGPEAIRYGSVLTPIGAVWFALSPRGVCRVALRAMGESRFVRDLRARRPGSLLERRENDADVSRIRKALSGYFRDGRGLSRLPVDLQGMTRFQRDVLLAAARIPAGRALSYGQVAVKIGRPRAARAVGAALKANPVPLLVPCHRVVASNGLGGFTVGGACNGVDLKRRLLTLERVRDLAP